MFDEQLGGILEARETKESDKTTLEILLNTYQAISAAYLQEFIHLSTIQQLSDQNVYQAYKQIYKQLSQPETQRSRPKTQEQSQEPIQKIIQKPLQNPLPDFSENDLEQLIRTMAATEFTNRESNMLFGLYTSVLLHILTERNEQLGKRTIMHLKQIDLDFLFYFAHKADAIILENCKGDEVLVCAGSNGGNVNTIVLRHFGESKGKKFNSDVLNDIASYNGSVNALFAYDVYGTTVAFSMASENGEVKAFVADKVGSSYFGTLCCQKNGRIGLCYINETLAEGLFEGAFDTFDSPSTAANESENHEPYLQNLYANRWFIDKLVSFRDIHHPDTNILQPYLTSKYIGNVSIIDENACCRSSSTDTGILQQYSVPRILEILRQDGELTPANIAEIVRISDEIKTIP